MSETEFFIYTDKGVTLPYYRINDTIYNHHNIKIKSDELSNKIIANVDIQYYSNDVIMNKVGSAALFVNIIYDDDDDFHSTYAILSSYGDSKFRIITFEDLPFNIFDYVPYDFVALDNINDLPPLNEDLLRPLSRRNGYDMNDISDTSGLRLKYYKVEPCNKPRMNLKTGFPDYVLYQDLRVTFITYKQFNNMRKTKRVYRFFVEKEVQDFAKPPNSLFIVLGTNGITYLLNAYYNKEKNTIHKPI